MLGDKVCMLFYERTAKTYNTAYYREYCSLYIDDDGKQLYFHSQAQTKKKIKNQWSHQEAIAVLLLLVIAIPLMANGAMPCLTHN